MGKTLLIVESPSKCKKIESFLGNDYKVIASCGHFTKLDSLDQINFENYNIKYKIDKGKAFKKLLDEIKVCKDVIIATDDDREGEAIGWTICVFCKLNIQTTKKITFQEITKPAILNALQNIKHINMDRVRSQQARQILDIYLGYKISPILWKYIQNKLSAGRCQTPALRLIYDNEIEIRNTPCETSYRIQGIFTSKNILFKGECNITNDNIDEFIEQHGEISSLIINYKKEQDKTEKQPQILITSSLQQKAYNVLRLSPKATMKAAQELYENGLITYMRTDSSCYSQEFINKSQNFINEKYGDDYTHENPYSLCKSKNKNKSQDAHEGIRVCYLDKDDPEIKSPISKRLYQMIYRHTLQTCMSLYRYHETTYIVESINSYKFVHVNECCIFDGWKKLEDIQTKTKQKDHSIYLNMLYEQKSPFKYKSIIASENSNSTKSHYNEASLIKKLENLNIGRPSTYSNIVHSLLDKKYVSKTNIEGKKMNLKTFTITQDEIEETEEEKIVDSEKNKLQITFLGEEVCKFCNEQFLDVFNYDFTMNMEEKLDLIENGEQDNISILSDFKGVIDSLVEHTKTTMKERPEHTKKLKEQNSIHCGKYMDKPIFIKHGPYGYYVNHGDNKKTSLKDFQGFDIEMKIKNQINEIDDDEMSCLVKYIEDSQTKSSSSGIIHLGTSCSIRKSKYGHYVFYKTKQMKKPKFYPYNDEKDDLKEERDRWISEQLIDNIKDYVSKKYKLNI
jgi:DNA topoisomerase-1